MIESILLLGLGILVGAFIGMAVMCICRLNGEDDDYGKR